MKLLKPSWVSHNGKLVQESGDQVGLLLSVGAELMRCNDGCRHLCDLFVSKE